MKRLLSILIVLGAVGPWTYGADPIFVSPDVPTTTTSGANLRPNDIVRYIATGPLWALELTVPGAPNVDGVHKMDEPGDWLFSIETPNTLAGALVAPALPGDVVWYDSSVNSYQICFSAASVGLTAETNVDAVYMIGGDQGSLFLSFDVHTDIGGFVGPTAVEPGDVVRFSPTGVGVCPGWAFAGLAFDASSAGAGVPNWSNVGGADDIGGGWILSLDIPTDVAPPALTITPGRIARTDTVTFSVFEVLTGWPITSEVDALSCLANPGRVPVTMQVDPSATPGDLTLTWQASCSSGGEDYGIYQGSIGSWYNHAAIDCNDGGTPLTEDITPAGADSYYLVVPHSQTKEEGSYGLDFVSGSNNERPVGGAPCSPTRVVTPCP
jgi:hypothetical protein